MPDALARAVTNTNPDSCVDAYCARTGKPWTLTPEGYKFIAVLESGIANGKYKGLPVVDGFILEVYDDGYGIPTVGLGHKVVADDKLKIGDKISVEQARDFLAVNLEPIEAAIHRTVKVALHPYEYDALVSILFNSGPYHRKGDPWHGTRAEYLADKINTGDYDKIPAIIESYIAQRVPGRRKMEARLFKVGNYDASH
jgi:lysozyme